MLEARRKAQVEKEKKGKAASYAKAVGKNTGNARKKIFGMRETEIEVLRAGRRKEGAREDEEKMETIRIKSQIEYKEVLKKMKKERTPEEI